VVRNAVSAQNTGFETNVSDPTQNGTIIVGGTKRKALSPFPQVRLRGKLMRNGARITLFTVTSPARARIDIRCTGRGCPRKSYVVTAKTTKTRVSRFEGFLKAGIHISVRVSRPGYVGKYSSFDIRALKAPVRHDLCLYSATAKPVKCTA